MKRLGIACLALALSACGFQLRGELVFPAAMQSTFVEYSGADAGMLRAIVRALSLNDIAIARSETSASAILHLPSAAVARRVLLKDVEGRPREYELTITLKYHVTTPDGLTIVPAGEVERSTNLALDPSQPLANTGDIERAVESLRDDAVWEMLRRIAAAPMPASGTTE